MQSLSEQFDSRTRHLLRTLIAQYLDAGEPVGSRTLARSCGLHVSPATIRNIMADLEDAGLVASPHTSAGRIPTGKGLRFFVDSLIELKPLPHEDIARLQREVPRSGGGRDLATNMSSLLSAMTHFVGVVTVPREDGLPIQHIEFMALPDERVLVVLVFANRQIQNRVLQMHKRPTSAELEQAARVLNIEFAGLNLNEIRQRIMVDLRAADSALRSALGQAVEAAEDAFSALASAEPDVVVSGQVNLLGSDGVTDMERLHDLFAAFQQKRELLDLLDRCSQAQGLRMFIGEESGYAALSGCSIVTASYGVGEQPLGSIGVIGPTRMDYDRVIQVVQTSADMLNEALNRVVSAS